MGEEKSSENIIPAWLAAILVAALMFGGFGLLGWVFEQAGPTPQPAQCRPIGMNFTCYEKTVGVLYTSLSNCTNGKNYSKITNVECDG